MFLLTCYKLSIIFYPRRTCYKYVQRKNLLIFMGVALLHRRLYIGEFRLLGIHINSVVL